MQQIDIKGNLPLVGLKEQLFKLVQLEKISLKNIEVIDIKAICNFFNSDLGKRVLASNYVKREMPFSMMVKAKEFYHKVEDNNEEIFIQGIIDVLFAENDKLILVDYKTDKSFNTAQLVEKYRVQLDLYSRAVENIFKKSVAEKYLYLFNGNKSIKI